MSGDGGMDYKRLGKCTSQQPIPKGPVRMRWGERVGGGWKTVASLLQALELPAFQPPLLPAKAKTPLQD